MIGASIKIPAELFALAKCSHFQGELDLPLLPVGPDDYKFKSPIAWEVDVTNTGAALLITGRATGLATVACARCLENVEYEFDGVIEGYFIIESSEVDNSSSFNEELGKDEFDVLPADHIIDLEPLICAALIVDAPQQILCSENCAGLCPTCGANLNEGLCSCSHSRGEDLKSEYNPFASLAALKLKP